MFYAGYDAKLRLSRLLHDEKASNFLVTMRINLHSSSPIQSSVWLFIEKLIFICISLIVTLVIARHLAPALFGQLNYLLALVALVSPLMALGLNAIVSRELLARPADSDLIIGSSLSMRFLGGLVVALLALCCGYLYLQTHQRYLFGFLIVASLTNAGLVVEYWLQAHVANSIASLVRLTGLFVFSIARLVAVGLDAKLAVFVYLVGLEFVFIASLYLLVYNRYGRGIRRLQVSSVECVRLWKDSRWLLISGLAAMIYLKVDQVMLGIMVDDAAVGIYAAAARISEVWYFVPAAIMTSFFPQMLVQKSSDSKEYQSDLQRLNDLLFIAALILALCVSVIANRFLPALFGVAYAEAVGVLAVHIWAGVFVFMRALLSKWLIAENLLRLSVVSQVLGALTNVVLNILLIPVYGPTGAAYATVGSFAVSGYLVLFLSRDLWPMAAVVTQSFLLPYRLLRKGRNLYSG